MFLIIQVKKFHLFFINFFFYVNFKHFQYFVQSCRWIMPQNYTPRIILWMITFTNIFYSRFQSFFSGLDSFIVVEVILVTVFTNNVYPQSNTYGIYYFMLMDLTARFYRNNNRALFDSVPLQPFHSIAKSEQIHLSSSWRLFHSCSARADEDAYTVIQSKCKSNGESVQSTLPQCISDEVIYTLFQQCLQQQNHLFKDIMLNCHYHTALKEFQQWRHEHAALLCCCRSYRRK